MVFYSPMKHGGLTGLTGLTSVLYGYNGHFNTLWKIFYVLNYPTLEQYSFQLIENNTSHK